MYAHNHIVATATQQKLQQCTDSKTLINIFLLLEIQTIQNLPKLHSYVS